MKLSIFNIHRPAPTPGDEHKLPSGAPRAASYIIAGSNNLGLQVNQFASQLLKTLLVTSSILGTLLYLRGASYDACLDELNFSRPGKGTWVGVYKDKAGKVIGPFVTRPERHYGDSTPDMDPLLFYKMRLNGAGPIYLDGDGMTDLQEYLAGTDPTNLGSFLRVITITQASTGQTTVLWSSVPGKSYRVEFTDDLGTSWNTLVGPVTADADQTTAVDPSAGTSSRRFYRVALVP